MRSALFVDFDNVYSGLRRLDPSIAERFAREPAAWLRWLADTLRLPPHAPGDGPRRLLVRRCYLNPQVYQRHRPAFNRAGFEIVDCPALTSENKTSTDIHMVLDIVDLLQSETRYDEFIVFSADADFTPVLRKLRRWDRRTTALAIGFPSAAYQASADLLIDPDDFVREALGVDDADAAPVGPAVGTASEPSAGASASQPGERRPQDPAAVRAAVARFILDAVAGSPRPVSLSWLAGKALASVSGLDAATWAGCDTFRGLVQTLPLGALRADWPAGVIADPARHADADRIEPARAATPDAAAGEAAAVAQLVRDELARAGKPVACGRIGQLIAEHHPRLAADWGGKGSFRRYLESLDLTPLRCDWSVAGGQIRDPARAMAAPLQAVADWGDARHLLPLITQVRRATGMPLLSPAELRAVLQALADDVADHPFALSETGKRVRDRCRAVGAISRDDVSFVLKGIALGGHVFGGASDVADVFATAFFRSVLALCEREQFALDDAQRAQLRAWAGLPPPPAPGAAPAEEAA